MNVSHNSANSQFDNLRFPCPLALIRRLACIKLGLISGGVTTDEYGRRQPATMFVGELVGQIQD
jgi:hypothetical protein